MYTGDKFGTYMRYPIVMDVKYSGLDKKVIVTEVATMFICLD